MGSQTIALNFSTELDSTGCSMGLGIFMGFYSMGFGILMGFYSMGFGILMGFYFMGFGRLDF